MRIAYLLHLIAFIGTCRVRSCAGSTNRHRGALRTTTLPGTPREARPGLLFRLGGRPPAHLRRGRSPLNQPTRDHADGATLGRRDAKASRRPRRPVMRARSGTAAATVPDDRGRNRHATVDSQDGCRYTIPKARGVAIGFQPVDDSDRIRERQNQPASVHHHRRRDAGATNIATPFASPTSRGRWNQPASAPPRCYTPPR